MRDFGRSDDPRVQAQLDRLGQLSVPQGRLGLDTITALLARLGDPHLRLPPVFHVAGTNGKGSTCAFLRAMLEAEGYKVHVTTSPHLVRYNERIRLAGELISDEALADLLAEVLDAGDGLKPSFFEVTIAAAFLAFSRTPADACVVEVGMGGRFDATNVLTPDVLAACGIAALGLDHERFLLAPEEGVPTKPMERIAFEKGGIAKRGVPLVSQYFNYDQPCITGAIENVAEKVGAPFFTLGGIRGWFCGQANGKLAYYDWQSEDGRRVDFALPMPSMPGRHQIENAGLAIAMLRHQRKIKVSMDAVARGLEEAKWPARLQRLSDGPLTEGREVWLDGGHNPSAGEALARHFAGKNVHLVIGMIEGKDPAGFMAVLGEIPLSIIAVPVPAHEWCPADAFGPRAIAAPDVPAALAALPDDGLPVLIAGSLYLAGEVLRLNNELPD
ncbi:bifunctional folylpolyglutamate synthase/dihydrofolate synthase [Altererythrobacter sp. Z27]|uniref:bifunctional folylpolyglutamate synthase/dihydrofolate synthase n=1 Tax=Altererythrobacter sp. Z27 TaxID=3461147 RepID=UPI004043CDE5